MTVEKFIWYSLTLIPDDIFDNLLFSKGVASFYNHEILETVWTIHPKVYCSFQVYEFRLLKILINKIILVYGQGDYHPHFLQLIPRSSWRLHTRLQWEYISYWIFCFLKHKCEYKSIFWMPIGKADHNVENGSSDYLIVRTGQLSHVSPHPHPSPHIHKHHYY